MSEYTRELREADVAAIAEWSGDKAIGVASVIEAYRRQLDAARAESDEGWTKAREHMRDLAEAKRELDVLRSGMRNVLDDLERAHHESMTGCAREIDRFRKLIERVVASAAFEYMNDSLRGAINAALTPPAPPTVATEQVGGPLLTGASITIHGAAPDTRAVLNGSTRRPPYEGDPVKMTVECEPPNDRAKMYVDGKLAKRFTVPSAPAEAADERPPVGSVWRHPELGARFKVTGHLDVFDRPAWTANDRTGHDKRTVAQLIAAGWRRTDSPATAQPKPPFCRDCGMEIIHGDRVRDGRHYACWQKAERAPATAQRRPGVGDEVEVHGGGEWKRRGVIGRYDVGFFFQGADRILEVDDADEGITWRWPATASEAAGGETFKGPFTCGHVKFGLCAHCSRQRSEEFDRMFASWSSQPRMSDADVARVLEEVATCLTEAVWSGDARTLAHGFRAAMDDRAKHLRKEG